MYCCETSSSCLDGWFIQIKCYMHIVFNLIVLLLYCYFQHTVFDWSKSDTFIYTFKISVQGMTPGIFDIDSVWFHVNIVLINIVVIIILFYYLYILFRLTVLLLSSVDLLVTVRVWINIIQYIYNNNMFKNTKYNNA